ncbi:MAG TPA: hypothetical protein GXX16_10190 [Epulopiscium sp.]|nr:hypothetical protein [Candidatus Epulonipiscium sp.]
MDIEISEFKGEGYKPMVDYMEWRVALLRYCEELEIDRIETMQKHTETDEVFVLLEGDCTLFTAGAGEEIGEIKAWPMEPLKIYNVKKGVWHTHTLSPNTSVLIVENRMTNDENSPIIKLSNKDKKILTKVRNL